jgi:O-antigen ligase
MTFSSRGAAVWTLPTIIILTFPFMAFFARALSGTVAVLICLAFLYRSYKNHDWAWSKTLWFRIALIIWVYLTFVVSPQSEHALHSILYSLTFIGWALFAAALANWLLADISTRRQFEWALVVLAAFVMADSVYQYFSGQDIFGHIPYDVRLTGPFKKLVPGTFTVRVFFIALAAIYFGLSLKSARAKVAIIACLLALGAGFEFLTGERSAFAIFMLGSFIVLLGLWLAHPDQRRFLLAVAATFALIVGIGASTQQKMVDRTIHSLVAGVTHYAEQPGGRILVSAFNIWKDHPALGIGITNFREVCPQYLARGEAPECNIHPHNIYMQWLVESGIIGLALFVALVVSFFAAIWKGYRDRSTLMVPLLATATVLTSLWPLMGSMSFFNSWIAAIIWMTVGWALAATNVKQLGATAQPAA